MNNKYSTHVCPIHITTTPVPFWCIQYTMQRARKHHVNTRHVCRVMHSCVSRDAFMCVT